MDVAGVNWLLGCLQGSESSRIGNAIEHQKSQMNTGVMVAPEVQVDPCLTDEAHRPLPERRSYVSRYAGARTLQQRSPRQTFLSPLLKSQRNC
jgi:hypothetical protein